MSEGASATGLEDLAVFAIVIYVIQGFAGYPITSIVLKREAKRLLKEHQQGNIQSVTQVEEDVEQASEQPKLFSKIPTKYNTEYFKFFRLALVGLLAYGTSTALAPVVTVNALVLCLVFGVLASTFGF